MKRKTPLKKRNAERRAKEFIRTYGSGRRVDAIRKLACCTCGARPSENAHIEGGGMGRKADADKIVNLCRACHRVLHELGSAEAFEKWSGVDLRLEAQRIDTWWRSIQ